MAVPRYAVYNQNVSLDLLETLNPEKHVNHLP